MHFLETRLAFRQVTFNSAHLTSANGNKGLKLTILFPSFAQPSKCFTEQTHKGNQELHVSYQYSSHLSVSSAINVLALTKCGFEYSDTMQ